MDQKELELVKRLVDRLEHLSADSIYAHRASGLRGSLLRYMQTLEYGGRLDHAEQARLEELVANGYGILELAAKEMGVSR